VIVVALGHRVLPWMGHRRGWEHKGTANGTLFCRGWDTNLRRWDTNLRRWDTKWDTMLHRWDTISSRWDTNGHQRTSKWCPMSLWSSVKPTKGSPPGFRGLNGRKIKSRYQKRTRRRFAILAACGIILPTGFQPCKGGDMVCARGPLGALYTYLSVKLRSGRRGIIEHAGAAQPLPQFILC
jgi:hypothetical protein